MARRSRTESRPLRVDTRPAGHPLRHLHWLSLDAVGVLLAYQWALGRWVGSVPPPEAWVLLGVGIWLGYTADRLLDLQRHPALALRSRKGAFYHRHRDSLWSVWVGSAVGVGLVGGVLLPARGILWAGAICAASALYLWWASSERCDDVSGAAAGRGLATVALLTVAGGWWMGVEPPERAATALPVAALFALAAWWNLALLRQSHRRPRLLRTLPALVPAAAILLIGFVPGSTALASCALVLVGGLAWASRSATSERGEADVAGMGRSDRDGLALAVDGVLAAGMVTVGVLAGSG